MSFYERYARICAEQDIEPCSQTAADMFGVTRATISIWNTKNTIPKGETVAHIADALNVSTDYLLGRTTDPTNYASPELIANVAGPVLDEFDGDVKKAIDFHKSVDEDVRREYHSRNLNEPSYLQQYTRLDEIDRAKADAYIAGLLAHEKYTRKNQFK